VLTSAALPPDVHRLELPSPFAIGDVNAYLLDGDRVALVDPGPRMRETMESLELGLRDLGRSMSDVDAIFLTHMHHDHVGLAAEVRERSGAKVVALDRLAEFLADVDAALDADDAYAVETMRRHGVAPDVAASLNQLSRAYRRFTGSVEVDEVLAPGGTVLLGSRSYDVRLLPGHSPTDTVLHDPAGRLLIAGDHLLPRVSSNPVAHAPIGVADPVACARSARRPTPLVDYLDSLEVSARLPADVVLPGHGDPFRGHEELAASRRALHLRRAQRILREVDGARTAHDIAGRLWRRIPVSQAYLALSETLAHLDLLAADGLVVGIEDADLVVRWRQAEEPAAAA
jgi:glyoxylase-like metal-dependent hydrolase (beta-lactamase superfamily II)